MKKIILLGGLAGLLLVVGLGFSSTAQAQTTTTASTTLQIICPTCSASSTMASIMIQKTVINDNGGTATPQSFEFFVGGVRVEPGVRYVFAPGTYPVSELIIAGGYLASPWGGNCTAAGSLTLTPGLNATCTVVNNDVLDGANPPPPVVVTPTTTPGIPNTGSGGNMALIFAIIGGAAVGTYFMSRGIKSINR